MNFHNGNKLIKILVNNDYGSPCVVLNMHIAISISEVPPPSGGPTSISDICHLYIWSYFMSHLPIGGSCTSNFLAMSHLQIGGPTFSNQRSPVSESGGDTSNWRCTPLELVWSHLQLLRYL